jgi:crotonobetainyl-CoA:carnitine CoA-transferase CaiB-like acyl-CoA transferase
MGETEMAAMTGPLEGIHVVDCSAFIAGPLATMILGDQGAEVIKVEPPGPGDIMRLIGTSRGGMSSLFANCNRSKRSIVLNLKEGDAIQILKDLVAETDVFVQNWRPGVAERLGIDEPTLRALRPGLIYVSSCAFGFEGPWSQRPAFDHVLQALTGIATLQADPDTGQPCFVRNTICDNATAYTTAQAISAALVSRARTGNGQHIRMSMLDAATSFMWPAGMANHTILEEDVQKQPPISVAYRMTKASDGFFAVAAATPDQQARLFRAFDVGHLLEDPRFATLQARMENLEELMDLLEGTSADFTLAEVLGKLEAADVPCAEVIGLDDFATHEQVVANGTLEESVHPVLGRIRQPRPAAQFELTPSQVQRPAPALGQHTDELLGEIGRTPDEVARLRAAGAVA